MITDALISECKQYRYWLKRAWNERQPVMGWVMLNPSTADAWDDDATIRVCMGRARLLGYGSIEVVNLFSYRSTCPSILRTVDDPIGQGTDEWIDTVIHTADITVAAWGGHGVIQGRGRRIRKRFRGKFHCLGVTTLGEPKHPLRIGYDVPLQRLIL